MRFQYRIKDKKCIWEKLTVHTNHQNKVILTLYYRIFANSRAEAAQDEAIFACVPASLKSALIHSNSRLHPGLHQYSETEAFYRMGEKNSDDPDSFPDVGEQTLLHHHIPCAEASEAEIRGIIKQFRSLETDGTYTKMAGITPKSHHVITVDDESTLMKLFLEYLANTDKSGKSAAKDAKAAKDARSDSSDKKLKSEMSSDTTIVHQMKIEKKEQVSLEEQAHLTKQVQSKFGKSFLTTYGSRLSFGKNENAGFAEVTLVNATEQGKAWILKKAPDCVFEKLNEKDVKVTIPLGTLVKKAEAEQEVEADLSKSKNRADAAKS